MAKKDSTNLDEFLLDVTKFTEKLVPEQVILFQKKIAFDAIKRIVEKTPVDTGRARGNWQVSIESEIDGTIEPTLLSEEKRLKGSKDLPSTKVIGDETIEQGIKALTDLKPYALVIISNNVEYIVFLEEGSSDQAPVGMIAVTLEELKTQFGE